jgi:hypothetical protein
MSQPRTASAMARSKCYQLSDEQDYMELMACNGESNIIHVTELHEIYIYNPEVFDDDFCEELRARQFDNESLSMERECSTRSRDTATPVQEEEKLTAEGRRTTPLVFDEDGLREVGTQFEEHDFVVPICNPLE